MAADYWTSSQREALLNSESFRDAHAEDIKRGLTWREIDHLYMYFNNYMVAVCSSSRKDGSPLLRRRVASAAATYFRWYYANASFHAADPRMLCLAALCLASKVHEMPVQAQGLLFAAGGIRAAWHDPPTLSAVLYMEVDLLAKVNESLYTFDPTAPLLAALESAGLNDQREVVHTAWCEGLLAAACSLRIEALLNDSYLTRAHLLHAPHDIAVACMLCAARAHAQDVSSWLQHAGIDHVSVHRAAETVVQGLQGSDSYRAGGVDHDMCHRYLGLLDPEQPPTST